MLRYALPCNVLGVLGAESKTPSNQESWELANTPLCEPKEFRKLDEGCVLLVAYNDEQITTEALRLNADKMKVLMGA